MYHHLEGLEFTDDMNDDQQLHVEILIVLDHHWDLTTGEVLRGANGPVSHTYKVWMGPVRSSHSARAN